MKQDEVIKLVAQRTGLTQEKAREALTVFGRIGLETIAKGEKFPIPSLGKIDVTHKAARPGRNPKTGTLLNIPDKRYPKFLPSDFVRDAAANGI
jgi:DNA-binding protein HU-beta